MSQQQKIAQLMQWIENRPEEEFQLLEDGITAIVDLAEEVFRELRAERENYNSPLAASVPNVPRPASAISILRLPSPAVRVQAFLAASPVPSVISDLRLPSAFSIHEGNALPHIEVESDSDEVDYHRYLTLQRLEGRAENHEDDEGIVEDRVRMWVLEQGLQGWEEVPAQAALEPRRQVALVVNKPLRRTRGILDLRAAAQGNLPLEVSAGVLSSSAETTDTPGGHFPLTPEARFEAIRAQTVVRRNPPPEAPIAPVESVSQFTGTTTPKLAPRLKKREQVHRFFRRIVGCERC